ncbi:hypothetical protein BGX26_003308 [Mortierella sp. AD094]|nr:hypothetical protein BGX26_003308 [Mortierella sp. AD094]
MTTRTDESAVFQCRFVSNATTAFLPDNVLATAVLTDGAPTIAVPADELPAKRLKKVTGPLEDISEYDQDNSGHLYICSDGMITTSISSDKSLMMSKIGRDPTMIPELTHIIPNADMGNQPNESEAEDGDDKAEDDDNKYTFSAGHVQHRWSHFHSLPTEGRPVFCPTAGFEDTFALFSENALVAILWGDDRKHANPARQVLEYAICSRQEAWDLAKNQYGELLQRLFIGDSETIKNDSTKRQTSYGKRTTTMAEFSRVTHEIYSVEALQVYAERLFAYYKSKKEATASGYQVLITPPSFPQPAETRNHRYALSNYLKTNGIQAHELGFDTRNPKVYSKARRGVTNLEMMFPDRASIVKVPRENYKDAIMVGVDPGEVVSTAFSLSYRTTMEQMKRQRGLVNVGHKVDSSAWTHPITVIAACTGEKSSLRIEDPKISKQQPIELPSSSTIDLMDRYEVANKNFNQERRLERRQDSARDVDINVD